MKKQKSPVILVSFLVILVAGVLMYGMNQLRPQGPPPPDPTELRGESRIAPSADQVKNAVGVATRGVKAKAIDPSTMDAPQIQLPPDSGPKIQKPMRRDPTTTTPQQWYVK